jgi:hypothetical protein
MGGRLPSESVAGLLRNQWPLCVGLRTYASLIIRWGGDASSDLLRQCARCTRCDTPEFGELAERQAKRLNAAYRKAIRAHRAS